MVIDPLAAALHEFAKVVLNEMSQVTTDVFDVLNTRPHASPTITVIGQDVVVAKIGGVYIHFVLSPGKAGFTPKEPPHEAVRLTVKSLGLIPTGKINDIGVGTPDTTDDGIPLTSGFTVASLPAINEKLKNARCAAMFGGSNALFSE